MIRRLLLSGVLVLFGPGSTVQSAMSILICLASIEAYSLYAPFREDEDDYLQKVTQWQLFMVLFAATLARVDASSDSASDQMYLGWLFIAFVVPGYVIMAWQCAKTYLDGFYKALDEANSWYGCMLKCLGRKRKRSGSTWLKRGRDEKEPKMVLEMTSTNDGSVGIEQENPITINVSDHMDVEELRGDTPRGGEVSPARLPTGGPRALVKKQSLMSVL